MLLNPRPRLNFRRASLLAAAISVLPLALGGQAFAAVDSAVSSGIRRGIYPAAVVVIGRRDSILYSRGYGHLTWSRAAAAPSPDSTLWDLASLTKVVATTPAIMRLVESGQIQLDQPLPSYLPRFKGLRKSEVTVRMLLDHTSGLPSYVEFFRLASTRDSAISLLYAEPLRRAPGDTAVYSDLNFMLLGLLVEQVSGEPLDRFVAREIFGPLGLAQTRYRPLPTARMPAVPSARKYGRPVAGRVNDQNAARLGGASGHAGVFSTGADLARYAQFWLALGATHGQQLFGLGTIRTFLEPSSASTPRLLGWERPEPQPLEPSAYGSRLSASAFGHTGWTGTMLWIDPARNLFLVFLTNRSYAPRISHSIRELRQLRGIVSDAVVAATGRN